MRAANFGDLVALSERSAAQKRARRDARRAQLLELGNVQIAAYMRNVPCHDVLNAVSQSTLTQQRIVLRIAFPNAVFFRSVCQFGPSSERTNLVLIMAYLGFCLSLNKPRSFFQGFARLNLAFDCNRG